MRKLKNKGSVIATVVLGLALILVLAGAGCNCTVGNNTTDSIRPANETADDSGSQTEVAITPTPTPAGTAVTTPAGTSCTLTKPSFGSSQVYHQILLKYFDAIDHKNYDIAFAMLADEALARYSSQSGTAQKNFSDFFTKNVGCIQVTGISDVTDYQAQCPMMSASLGIQCYQVELEYYPPSGTANPVKVPKIYTVHSDPHAEGDRVENGQIINIQD